MHICAAVDKISTEITLGVVVVH